MPLLICIVLCLILFYLEGCYYVALICKEERELRRYHAVEHPRRMTSDQYLDRLG